MSLRRRFVLTFAAYGVALAAVIGTISWKISRDALEEQLDRRLTDVAAAVNAVGIFPSTLSLLREGDENLLGYTSHLSGLQALQGVVERSFIFTTEFTEEKPQFRAIVSSEGDPIGTELYFLGNYSAEITEAVQNGRSVTRLFRDPVTGRPYKFGFIEIQDGEPWLLGVLIPADFLAPVGRLKNTLLLTSGGALLLAVLLGGLLAAGIVQPLEGLSKAALRIQRGRLDRPIDSASAQDELNSLARAMERMRAAILERDERLRVMLAQVAHEIRNPLGGLELFASAAASAEDPRERRRLIERVRAEVAALNRIIDDFLTFARPLSPDYEPVDLRAAIQEAADLTEAELSHEGILEVFLPEQPLLARADRDQVKRAVLNLLRNAAQSGVNVRIWAGEEQGDVMIAVMDDGPGISLAVRDRIFDPFVTDKQKGAGLGLAIVKKVAEAHGGRVEVRAASDPKYGSGAEFRLYLSASAAPSALLAPTPVG